MSNTAETEASLEEFAMKVYEGILKTIEDEADSLHIRTCYVQFVFMLQYVDSCSWLEDLKRVFEERAAFKKQPSKVGALLKNFERTGEKLPKKCPNAFRLLESDWQKNTASYKAHLYGSTGLTWLVKQFRKSFQAAFAVCPEIAQVFLLLLHVDIDEKGPRVEFDSEATVDSPF
ncbi:MAG: hypothetical protein SGARI_003018 [Bacillariaceae sp.]